MIDYDLLAEKVAIRVVELMKQKKKAQRVPEPDVIPSLVKSVLDDLYLVTGKAYSVKRKKTHDLIMARWKEGHNISSFMQVHNNMSSRWKNDPKMSQFLRPETLYSNKFESYLNAGQRLTGVVSEKVEQGSAAIAEFLRGDEIE